MTVLDKRGPAGVNLSRVGRGLTALALVALLTIGVAMAINPKVEPATRVEQEQSVAPFLANTDAPSHKGRISPIDNTLGPDSPFLAGTDSPTHKGRISPIDNTLGPDSPFLAGTDSPTHTGPNGR